MKKELMLVLFFIYVSSIFAQTSYKQKDVEICNSTFELAVSKELKSKPINEIIIELGKSFLGTDYKSHTIESKSKEKLVINLSGFDCYTFLESILALARNIKNDNTSFENYLKEIKRIRYRKGRMKNYPSRLHYFSDWIYDSGRRRIVKDVTKQIGGVSYNNKVHFMSMNPHLYPQLRKNPNFIEEMKIIEDIISNRDYFYIPQNKIKKLESGIKSGDIIGLTTGIKGLDIAHTGIAIRMDDGRIHLMHAPSEGKKVQISEKPLADYVKGNRRQTGIMVARPL